MRSTPPAPSAAAERESLFSALWWKGPRVAPNRARSFGYVSWLPLVIDFGYLRYNRHWFGNLHARFATVYRLHYGHWPTYWYWDHPGRCEACECPDDRLFPRSHSRNCTEAKG